MENTVSIPRVLLAVSVSLICSQLYAVDPPPDGGYPNQNTAEGEDALLSLATGVENTAVGYHAIYSQTLTSYNTAIGANALALNISGYYNTAVGADALASNDSTHNNTAIGYATLSSVGGPSSSDNVAVGYRAMALAETYSSVAVGSEALVLDEGQLNVAVGKESLTANTIGEGNAALGWRSLFNNQEGNYNTAVGSQAMFSQWKGNFNVALGYFALGNNTRGKNNIAIGTAAGKNTVGDNNIDIGNLGIASEANTIRIGTEGTQIATYIAGIRQTGLVKGSALQVGITADGQLGVRASSARFKEAIKPMDKTSEAILRLKPVTFRYKKELDPERAPQFGLVAEEVAKVNPDLVVADDQGKPFTVRYDEVNAMLLNEFLKEHKKVEEQATLLKQQEERLEKLEALIGTTKRY